MDNTSLIVLISCIVIVVIVFFITVRSTTKTIDSTLQEAKDQILSNKFNDFGNKSAILGGSRSKSSSKTKSQCRHPYLTTTNAFLLFAVVFTGYILSHFL